MALMRWTPPREMERLMDEFFEKPFLRFRRNFPILSKFNGDEMSHPAVDMYDNENEIVVKAEIPGVEKENVNISLTNNTLTIKGETKKEEEVKEEDYYYSERSHGKFVRTLSLPEEIDVDKVKADFKDGILEIHLPKTPEAKPKEIKVKVA